MAPQKKVLIVDDEKALARLLQKILTKQNYDSFVAYDGKEAIDMANKHKPDFILLDIAMPKMDGLEVLKQLRSTSEFSDTPIVILSAKDQLHEIRAGIDAGANRYLSKPVMHDTIMDTIQEFLS